MTLPLPDFDQRPSLAPSSARPLHAQNPEIDDLAERVAQQLGYAHGAVLPPLLERLGVTLRTNPVGFGGGSSVLLEALGPHVQVLLDPDTGPLHDRFQIVRALGHWVMHYLLPNQRDAAGLVWLRVDRYEVDEAALHEANRFAFAFLMPEAAVREIAPRLHHDVLRVAGHFKVAPRIAGLRMKGLGIHCAGTNPEAPAAAQAAQAMAVPPSRTVGEAMANLPTLPMSENRPHA